LTSRDFSFVGRSGAVDATWRATSTVIAPRRIPPSQRAAFVHPQTAEALKAMAVHDSSLFEETYNLLNAWLSIVPGNGAHNLRRWRFSNEHRRPQLPVHARSP
jgi:hypothetical protein